MRLQCEGSSREGKSEVWSLPEMRTRYNTTCSKSIVRRLPVQQRNDNLQGARHRLGKTLVPTNHCGKHAPIVTTVAPVKAWDSRRLCRLQKPSGRVVPRSVFARCNDMSRHKGLGLFVSQARCSALDGCKVPPQQCYP